MRTTVSRRSSSGCADLSPQSAKLLACQLIGIDPAAHAALGATLKIDAKGAKGRYLRVYGKGSTASDFNHFIEVEVWGK